MDRRQEREHGDNAFNQWQFSACHVKLLSQKGPWSLSEDSELKCFTYCDNSDPLDQGF